MKIYKGKMKGHTFSNSKTYELADVPFVASRLNLEIGNKDAMQLDFDHFGIFIDYNDDNLKEKLSHVIGAVKSTYFTVDMSADEPNVALGVFDDNDEAMLYTVCFEPEEQNIFLWSIGQYFYFGAVWGEPVHSNSALEGNA